MLDVNFCTVLFSSLLPFGCFSQKKQTELCVQSSRLLFVWMKQTTFQLDSLLNSVHQDDQSHDLIYRLTPVSSGVFLLCLWHPVTSQSRHGYSSSWMLWLAESQTWPLRQQLAGKKCSLEGNSSWLAEADSPPHRSLRLRPEPAGRSGPAADPPTGPGGLWMGWTTPTAPPPPAAPGYNAQWTPPPTAPPPPVCTHTSVLADLQSWTSSNQPTSWN